MSVYTLASRISSVESNVDELENKADSMNAVFAGITWPCVPKRTQCRLVYNS